MIVPQGAASDRWTARLGGSLHDGVSDRQPQEPLPAPWTDELVPGVLLSPSLGFWAICQADLRSKPGSLPQDGSWGGIQRLHGRRQPLVGVRGWGRTRGGSVVWFLIFSRLLALAL